MVVMFGPVLLTGLVFVFDYVAASEWGVKVGLSEDPRSRLTKFYQKHNPSKMRDVSRGGGVGLGCAFSCGHRDLS